MPAMSMRWMVTPAARKRSTVARNAAVIGGSTSGSGSGAPSANSSNSPGRPVAWPIAAQNASMSAAVWVKKPSVSRLFAYWSTPSIGK